MKIIYTLCLIFLAVYWGKLLSPKVKAIIIKLKNKLTKNNNNQEKEKENESKSN